MTKHISINSLLRAAELLEEYLDTLDNREWHRKVVTWYDNMKEDEQRIRNEEY